MALHRLALPALLVAVLFTAPSSAPSAPPDKTDKADKAEGKRPPWELAKAKVEAARKTCQAIAAEYLEGRATVEQVHTWSRRWMGAQRDTSKKPQDQTAALEAHIARMQQLERAAQDRVAQKKAPVSDVTAAEYHRLDAELELSRTKNSK